MPRILLASSAASATDLAILTPPPLPRPPAWIWAFTTTPVAPAESRFLAAVCASSRVMATSPRGTATPYLASRVLAWYSWIFMDGRQPELLCGLKTPAGKQRFYRTPQRGANSQRWGSRRYLRVMLE